MSKTNEVLDRVEAVLAKVQKNEPAAAPATQDMTPDQFLAHAQSEVAKAKGEPRLVAQRRLKVLAKAVEVAKAEQWESTETAKIPIFTESTTASSDLTDKTLSKAPDQPAATQYSANSQAEFTAKMAKIEERLKALKAGPSTGGGGTTEEDDEEEEDVAEAEAETDEALEDEREKDKEKAKGKPAKKGEVRKAVDDDGWPEDLNAVPVPKDWGFDD